MHIHVAWRIPAIIFVGCASAVVAWEAVGPLAEVGGTDQLVTPPEWAVSGGPIPVVLATIALLAGAAWLAGTIRTGGATPRREATRKVVSAISLAVLAGALLGLVGRLATARSVGANIGGMAAIVFGAPIALGLLAGALLSSRDR